jgi:hypothetical protein
LGETTDQERLIDKERNETSRVKLENRRVSEINRGNEIDRQKHATDLEFIYKESQRVRS